MRDLPDAFIHVLIRKILTFAALLLFISGCGQADATRTSRAAYPAPSPAPYPPPSPITVIIDTPAITPSVQPTVGLIGASRQQLTQAALKYTNDNYPSITGTPTVILIRPITANQLPSLGFGEVSYAGTEEPPLMLVILKGDFDITSLFSGLQPRKVDTRVKYIAYVYDLRAGLPMLTAPSTNGGKLRRALNDPSLPDDPTAEPGEAVTPGAPAVPMPPQPTPHTTRPYGSIAPPAATAPIAP